MWFEIVSPWRRTQIKGSKHVGQWNGTINVFKLYICRKINIDMNQYQANFKEANSFIFPYVAHYFIWPKYVLKQDFQT
jgi:hypothetical protein